MMSAQNFPAESSIGYVRNQSAPTVTSASMTTGTLTINRLCARSIGTYGWPDSCVHLRHVLSFCSQGDDRVEARGSHSRVEPEADADDRCYAECNEDREGTHDQWQTQGR